MCSYPGEGDNDQYQLVATAVNMCIGRDNMLMNAKRGLLFSIRPAIVLKFYHIDISVVLLL